MNWILENKEWVFSGVGVALITFVFSILFKSKRSKHTQKQTVSKNSTGYQAGGDIQVGESDGKK